MDEICLIAGFVGPGASKQCPKSLVRRATHTTTAIEPRSCSATLTCSVVPFSAAGVLTLIGTGTHR